MHVEALDYVVLIVEDLDRSLAFYHDLMGIPLKHQAPRFAQLQTGTTRLALFTREAMADTLHQPLQAPTADAPAFELGFKVTDVDAAYQELVDEGATPVTAPETRPWGQRTAYVRDPDGHLIELVTQLSRP